MGTLVEVPEGADMRERLLEGDVFVGTFLAAFHRDPPSAPQNLATPGAYNTQLHRIDQYQAVFPRKSLHINISTATLGCSTISLSHRTQIACASTLKVATAEVSKVLGVVRELTIW